MLGSRKLSTLVFIFSFIGNFADALNRTHFVAVLEEEWDYAPEGNLLSNDHRAIIHQYRDNGSASSYEIGRRGAVQYELRTFYGLEPGGVTGKAWEGTVSDIFMKTQTNPPQIGSKYLKALLREYTDDTYTIPVTRPSYMGMIGPFLRGEVGDIIKVNLWNKAKYNYSLHPHGVFYDKDDEGAQYLDGTTGADLLDNAVPPNGKYEYEWTIKPQYGPLEHDPDCISYIYHSHDEAEIEIMSGVIGILLVCKQGTLDEAGKRLDVDKEFPLLFMGVDENFSHYLGRNMQHHIPNATTRDVIANFKNFHVKT